MSEAFLSEIRLMSFNFAPRGWALCNGQLLPINQNQALFSLLGTTYGGNGTTNFALPNLQGRTAIHMGAGFTLGQAGGAISHTLIASEMPTHFHQMQAFNGAADTGATNTPPSPTASLAIAAAVPSGGGSTPVARYSTAAPTGSMAATAVSTVGGSQAHENRQPYAVLNWCIALQGIFPSQN